jgi:fucose 4-O-acetylase-like acetyltransferase
MPNTKPLWNCYILSFQQGYFMGLLFMIAGYFVAGSYDRKGFGLFVGERFKRLIIPTLIYYVFSRSVWDPVWETTVGFGL